MLDLHCHILPGIDDGAPDVQTSLAMARIAVDDGITLTACTPHIYPGLYDNNAQMILQGIEVLTRALQHAGIDLQLTCGADTHLAPDLVGGLRNGRIPTLNHTRYFLLEPPHHVLPPRLIDSCFALQSAGYVPVLTHPERLSYVDSAYGMFQELARRGIWMQITAGSLTGRFGSKPRYWAEKMMDEGLVHILATDSHGVDRRPPLLAEGRQAAEKWVDKAEALRLVVDRPRAIIDNLAPDSVVPPPGLSSEGKKKNASSWWKRLFT